jgi:hypothetical protein
MGLKCLNVSAGHGYISQDVLFDESITPFPSLHPNTGGCLRAEIDLLPSHLYTGHDGGCIVANTADSSNPML